MSSFKLINDHKEAAERFISEVGSNSVRCYDINSFQSSVIPSVYPASYLDKCTSMYVAVSGTQSVLDWMVFCPYRVDKNVKSGILVHDIDPLIVTLDSSQQPSPVGIIGYHQNFPGRTVPITGYALSDYATSVNDLRKQLITGLAPLGNTPEPVKYALHHMAEHFSKTKFD